MENKKEGLGAMAPNAVFVFGLVTGVAVTLIFGSLSGTTLASKNNDFEKKVVVNDGAPTQDIGEEAKSVPPLTDEDHLIGDPNAPLTLIEYSDFECPFCKRFHPTVERLVDEYDGQVNWVYRHFPLSFHDPLATKAAEGSECANELGGNSAFWEFSDEYYDRTSSNGNGVDLDELADIASDIGLNSGKFQECLDSGKYTEHVMEDLAGGSTAGVTGTPGSLLVMPDGSAQLISGAVPYEQLSAAVDSALAEL